MAKKILVVDDEKLIRWSLQKDLSAQGYSVSSAATAGEAQRALENGSYDLVLCDLKLPDFSGLDLLHKIKKGLPDLAVIVITAYGDITSAVDAMKAGASDFITKPFEPKVLNFSIQRALETSSLRRRMSAAQSRRKSRYNFNSVVAFSPAMKQVADEARKMCQSQTSTILIQGESGTGKDFLARVIHYESPRSHGPFMEISCTSIPENLLESELFGYEKGAFTDARAQKKGLFELAEEGTVFLNEIGHMSPGLQVKILRIIEDKIFKRLGGTEDIQVSVRVIAATNQDLEKAIEAGTFRNDLFFRLNVLALLIPPLRERREDILPLMEHFSARLSQELKKPELIFTADAQKALQEYDWPGNCRELRNIMERLLILSGEREISGSCLADHMKVKGRDAKQTKTLVLPEEGLFLDNAEKILIRQALDQTKNNQVHAAKLLRISRDALRYRMQKHGLVDKNTAQ